MTLLADYFRQQAAWRESKAVEYPDDKRNAQSAAALMALADYYENDPDVAHAEGAVAREILDHYAEICEAGTGFVNPGEEVQRVVSRYGFDYLVTRGHHGEFIAGLVPLALLDTYELVRSGAPDTDRSDEHLEDLAEQYGLSPWEIAAALDDVPLDATYFERQSHGRMTQPEQEAWIDEVRAAEGFATDPA